MAADASTVVARVGLDDRGFQEGVAKIQRGLKLVQSEFAAASSRLGDFGKSTDGLRLKADTLNKQIELQKDKVAALNKSFQESVEKKGADAKATENLKVKLNYAIAELNNMQRELKVTTTELNTKSSAWYKLSEGMDKAGEKMKAVGEKMTSVGTKLSAAVTLPLLGAGTAATKMAMDAVESENLFEVAMGGMAGDARKWSEETSKALGLNAYNVRNNMATYNAMLTSMGLASDESLKMSEGLTQLSYDMASFYNLKPEEAFEKLKSGISGEAEPLKALGILVNDTTIKTYAYANGIAKQGQELTEAQKVQARYGAIMEATKNAQGDLGRTMDSPTNKIRIMKEQAEQIGIQFGQILIPILEKLIAVIKPLMDKFQGLSKEQQENIVKIGLIVAAIGPVILIVGKVITIIGTLSSIISAVSGAIATAGGASATLGAVFTALTGPVGIAIAVITGLVAIGVLLYKNWDTIKNTASTIWQALTTSISNSVTAIKTAIVSTWESIKAVVLPVVEGIANVIKTIWEGVKTGFAFLWEVIKAIFISAWTIISSIVQTYINIVTAVISVAWQLIQVVTTTVWNAVYGVISTVWNGIVAFLNPIIQEIVNVLTGAWNAIKSVTTTVFNAVSSIINTVWNSIVNFITPIINSIVSTLTTAWNTIKSVTITVWNAIQSALNAVWSVIKNTTTSVWNSISSFFSSMWSGVSSLFTNTLNGIKNTVSNVWSSILGVTTNVWNNIKSAIMTPINVAVNFVKEQIDRIKGFFDRLDIKFPHIKLPHFSIEGEFSLKPPSVPHLGVSWYASGGIFNRPSVIGVGEAGTEAVLPIDRLDDLMAKAIEKAKGGSGSGLTLHIENFINNTEKDIEQLAYELEFYRQRVAIGRGKLNMLSFNFGDKNSYKDYGIIMAKRPSIPSAKRRVNYFNIPGRSGSLKFDESTYEDITITVECSLKSPELANKIDEIKAWLFETGESDLIFSYQLDKKYIAQVVNAIDFKQAYKYVGNFPILFNCRPFKYESSSDVLMPASSPFTFKNTGTLPSEPVITVYGTGLIKLNINEEIIELHDVNGMIELDSELKECYDKNAMRNSSMYGEFPIFKVGENKISWEGTVTNLYIKPNFRSL